MIWLPRKTSMSFRIDEARQLLLIKGAIPGSAGGFVTVRPAVKAKPEAAKGAN
jgi:large subunit ribosomal protein L3